ncbi:hypothetical protein NHX12_004029 [Muraenolepis orangiensis]|uniref:Septin-type G domain-containing protein n=1 Tax=Muraenolepis orangiensis TaxID=630683 RepID=A0A9Q0DY85_9TELE|nr:hypothetical protein NHX12_004029 [Muraenolepis orangiensis]
MEVDGCRRFALGEDNMVKPNRTIMMLGATGSGKSTLVNGMINYILGVEWEDNFRFKLVNENTAQSQAHSQTSEVTVYKLNYREGFKIDYSLTIVDTPGFGDTRGIERDRMIIGQLENLFKAPLGKYVFDSVLSIFGNNVADNIRILVTFADGQLPPALTAIKESGAPCPKRKDGLPVHFKFNNSAMFADNKVADSALDRDDEDGPGNFDEMFWAMGTKSMKNFFSALDIIETQSLTLTKEVLQQRGQLEITIENLQKKVKLGLAKLEEIKQDLCQIVISEVGKFVTNCQVCSVTCHYPCVIPNDEDKIRCGAMGPDGNCQQCENKCTWSLHFNQKYRWDYQQVTEKRTYKELKDKYQKATKKAMSVQDVMKQMRVDYKLLQEEVLQLMESSTQCLNRLKEIALKPNPLSTLEYIDLLIQDEKSEVQ